jgi:hypothetical protein
MVFYRPFGRELAGFEIVARSRGIEPPREPRTRHTRNRKRVVDTTARPPPSGAGRSKYREESYRIVGRSRDQE